MWSREDVEEELLRDPGWAADREQEGITVERVFLKRENKQNKKEKRKGLIRCFLGKFF